MVWLSTPHRVDAYHTCPKRQRVRDLLTQEEIPLVRHRQWLVIRIGTGEVLDLDSLVTDGDQISVRHARDVPKLYIDLDARVAQLEREITQCGSERARISRELRDLAASERVSDIAQAYRHAASLVESIPVHRMPSERGELLP